jgi:hypothetical protein
VVPDEKVRARDLIGQIVKSHIAPGLKSRGFRKDRYLWSLQQDELVQFVALQSSRWSHGDEGEFTFNLGVHWPTPYEDLIGARLPYHYLFWRRIGWLIPLQKDYWWNVSRASDLDAIGRQVIETVTGFGLPALDQFRSPDKVREHLRARVPEDLCRYNPMRLLIMEAKLGQLGDFRQAWEFARKIDCHAEDAERVEALAQRLIMDYRLASS